MPAKARTFSSFAEGLRISYEEEVSGEAFFAALAGHQSADNSKALMRFAQMERITFSSIQYLPTKHHVTTSDELELHQAGIEEANSLKDEKWDTIISDMIETYPAFIDEFKALKYIAPEEDRATIDILVEHEKAMLEFAIRQQDGQLDPMRPLEEFIQKYGPLSPVS